MLISVQDASTVVLLYPSDETATRWLLDHAPEPDTWSGIRGVETSAAYPCSPKYVQGLLRWFVEDGGEVCYL